MRPNLITRLKEEWNNLDPVDPLCGLIADAIFALTQPAQPAQQQACDSKTGESETQSDLKFTGETQAQQQEPVAKSAANHKKGEVGFCEFLKDVPNGSVLYTSPQPTQQEPVGQLVEEVYGRGQVLWFDKPDDFSMLYTSPPPSKPWVGLTTEDRIDLYKETKWLELEDVIRLTDSKLREKNA